MANKTFILLALIALFSTTVHSQSFLGISSQVQDTTDLGQEMAFDELSFGDNEEEMSFEEGEFQNEEGEFSNEEGEFMNSEEEMILVGANNDFPSVPALSNMAEDDMLGDMWIGANEEEMSFEENEFSNEEGEFALGEGEFGNEETEFSLSNLNIGV